MSANNNDHFEKNLSAFRDAFIAGKPAPKRHRAKAHQSQAPGLKVILVVRQSDLSLEYLFEVQTNTISRLQAKIEAEREAKKAGWKIIGRVHDIH